MPPALLLCDLNGLRRGYRGQPPNIQIIHRVLESFPPFYMIRTKMEHLLDVRGNLNRVARSLPLILVGDKRQMHVRV